jgi:hypothetical protein
LFRSLPKLPPWEGLGRVANRAFVEVLESRDVPGLRIGYHRVSYAFDTHFPPSGRRFPGPDVEPFPRPDLQGHRHLQHDSQSAHARRAPASRGSHRLLPEEPHNDARGRPRRLLLPLSAQPSDSRSIECDFQSHARLSELRPLFQDARSWSLAVPVVHQRHVPELHRGLPDSSVSPS